MDRYVAALCREMEMVAPDLKPRTVFFGGGTPSLLNLAQWERILEMMGHLRLLGAAEWTVECNPATVSLDKARLLRSYGVNRISMGVQSLDPALLERLGRIHTRDMVFKSFDIFRRAGFNNINLDLMFGIPGQTLVAWRQTLAEVFAMGSEHLATYEVIYEEDTPLFEQLKAGRISADEDLACEMYEDLSERAAAEGFQQYEVANFARRTKGESRDPTAIPALACQHNVNYWQGGSFHGLGPSATSYVGGVRTKNWSNTPKCCDLVEKGQRPVESTEQLAPLSRAGETAAFGLRMVAGLEYNRFLETTGFDLRQEWMNDMLQLERQALAQVQPDRFRLTRRGLRFADAVAQEFLR